MKTVLVLGAGSSLAFGYPTGDGLRDLIIDLGKPANQRFCLNAGLQPELDQFKQFLKAFKFSDMASIDAFLARRTEFSEIGRRCIAAVLLRLEIPDALDVPSGEDKWASYLHRRYASETWDDLDYSNLKIVTFNYDRAFEHYMVRALRYTYNKTEAEAIAKFNELEIIHIYGSLGATLAGIDGYVQYGHAVDAGVVQIAANSLKVIREGNDDDPSIQRARSILKEALSVVFMGFSFDATNMDRLAIRETCEQWIQTPQGLTNKQISATCYGMTRAEAQRAGGYFRTEINRDGFPPGFVDGRCIDMLRQTLVLG